MGPTGPKVGAGPSPPPNTVPRARCSLTTHSSPCRASGARSAVRPPLFRVLGGYRYSPPYYPPGIPLPVPTLYPSVVQCRMSRGAVGPMEQCHMTVLRTL